MSMRQARRYRYVPALRAGGKMNIKYKSPGTGRNDGVNN